MHNTKQITKTKQKDNIFRCTTTDAQQKKEKKYSSMHKTYNKNKQNIQQKPRRNTHTNTKQLQHQTHTKKIHKPTQ